MNKIGSKGNCIWCKLNLMQIGFKEISIMEQLKFETNSIWSKFGLEERGFEANSIWSKLNLMQIGFKAYCIGNKFDLK